LHNGRVLGDQEKGATCNKKVEETCKWVPLFGSPGITITHTYHHKQKLFLHKNFVHLSTYRRTNSCDFLDTRFE